MTDLVFIGASVVDGTGSPAYPGSVAVAGDRIERVVAGALPEPMGARRVEASGRVLAPGFVDVHSHSDVSPFVEPSMSSPMAAGSTPATSAGRTDPCSLQ